MQADIASPGDMPTVRIVDDDAAVRTSLLDLLRSADFQAVAFESPASLLGEDDLSAPGCIVLDVRLAGENGLDFQSRLQDDGIFTPVVMITGHGDIPMTVRAMRAGAVDFLEKPFQDNDLIEAVERAIEKDRVGRIERDQQSSIVGSGRRLSPREWEIMHAVVSGLMNKQIAADFGISEVTVKLHRSNVMKKMQARSLADLVRKAEVLKSNGVGAPARQKPAAP